MKDAALMDESRECRTGSLDFASFTEMALKPLADDSTNPLSRIYASPDFDESRLVGITEQFLSEAATYHQLYWHPEAIQGVLEKALAGRSFTEPFIFDVGSGSGNSVFAFANMFPDCEIVATDLSPRLLAILENIRMKQYAEGPRICSIAIDAHDLALKENVFDIFSGTSILHHLIEPKAIMQKAYHSLRGGGWRSSSNRSSQGILF